jgi:CHAT domain-containing protein/tetratricopeptide (TPR) repeat protein
MLTVGINLYMARRDSRMRPVRQALSLFLGLAFWAMFAVMCHAHSLGEPLSKNAKPSSPSQADKDIHTLELGKPVERELSRGQAHSYSILLGARQYIKLVVDQRGIDVVVLLFGPDGKQIIKADSPNGAHGPEHVSTIAESSGTYRLEVRSLEKDAPAGRYGVTIVELRTATTRDESRIAAEQAFTEAELLRAQGTIESLRKSIESYEKAVPLYRETGDRSSEALALNRLGMAYNWLGEARKALGYYSQALLLMRAVGDRNGEATVLINVGAVYDYLGEKQEALDSFTRALSLIRESGDLGGEAFTLSRIGAVYNSLGDRRKALDYYSQALPLVRSIGDYRSETATLNNTGKIYSDLGEKQKALDFFNQALSVSRNARDQLREAITLNNIGLIYAELGEYQKALESYQQVLTEMHEVKSRFGEAEVINNIAAVYNSLGEKQKAFEYYRQGLILFRELGERRGEATALTNIGLIYSELGEKQKALDYLSQAMTLMRAVEDRGGEATVLNNVGMVYAVLGEKQKAIDYYNQALPLFRAIGDRNGEARTLNNIACSERDLGELNDALAHIEAAVNIIESLRAKIGSQELRSSFFATVQDYYDSYIDILMRLHRRQPDAGYVGKALQASERVQARGLLELLTEAGADIRQGVDPTLVERERVLQLRLSASAQRQMRLLSAPHTGEQTDAIAREVTNLTTELQEVEARIRETSPRYAALTQPRPLTLVEIQTQALDADTLLLEYSLGTDRSYLWAVTPTSITSYELPKREEIEVAALEFYESIHASSRGVVSGTKAGREAGSAVQQQAQTDQAAARLSRMLLAPASALLSKKRLLIVADGALQYIPFAALPAPTSATGSGTLTPLIVEHEIVSFPSASSLIRARQSVSGRKPPAKILAVFADPVFEKDDSRVMRKQGLVEGANQEIKTVADSIEGEGIRIRRLPGTRREALSILSLIPREKSLAALDFSASRNTALSPELARYRIIHFATHAFINSVHPELSGIVLSLVDEHGKPQDGFLRAYELFNLRLSAELVVLSGSDTGLGQKMKGEGAPGLTYGFIYAGAARVVVSLWSVDDTATAELMVRFYRKLLVENLRPAAALRLAQIEMWKDKRWKAPYYWAGFILQGEWR